MKAESDADLRAALKKYLFLIIGDDDPTFALELLNDYIDTAVPLVQAMRNGLNTGDLTLVSRSAHTLKSSSGALGAKSLQRNCETLEYQANTGSTLGLSALVSAVERSFGTFETVVRDEIASLEAAS